MCEGVRAELPTGSDEASDVAVREAPRLEIAELQVQDGPPAAPGEDRQCVPPDTAVAVVELITTGLGGKAAPASSSAHVGERDRLVTVPGQPLDLIAELRRRDVELRPCRAGGGSAARGT